MTVMATFPPLTTVSPVPALATLTALTPFAALAALTLTFTFALTLTPAEVVEDLNFRHGATLEAGADRGKKTAVTHVFDQFPTQCPFLVGLAVRTGGLVDRSGAGS
jgi:hypothetical protein